jgi:flagellar basal body-associated protein FliL
MSEPEATEAKPAAAKTEKGGLAIVGLVLPALIAGGAAFGGAKFSAAHAAPAPVVEHAAPAPPPPGPTISLEPFVLLTPDSAHKMHAMKVTLAVEFEEKVKEETLKGFTPRVRDAVLGYLRTLAYEDATDGAKSEKMRADLLERIRGIGATAANRVLITDLVIQ